LSKKQCLVAVLLQSAIDKAMADYDLIEGFNYNLSMEDFTIK